MKTQRKQQRSVNSIPTGRWKAYAAAAAASGFAATHTAEATIHYSGPINQKIIDEQAVILPLDPAGGSFLARHRDFSRRGGFAYFNIYGAQSAFMIGSYSVPLGDNVFPFKLDRGYKISAGHFTSVRRDSVGGILAGDNKSYTFDSEFGHFLKRGTGLIGFKFNNGAGDQYGWVRLSMKGGLNNNFKVVDYAYGDPGDVVLAGQKSDDSAPGLESLGGLAIGAAGLLAWRGQRTK